MEAQPHLPLPAALVHAVASVVQAVAQHPVPSVRQVRLHVASAALSLTSTGQLLRTLRRLCLDRNGRPAQGVANQDSPAV